MKQAHTQRSLQNENGLDHLFNAVFPLPAYRFDEMVDISRVDGCSVETWYSSFRSPIEKQKQKKEKKKKDFV